MSLTMKVICRFLRLILVKFYKLIDRILCYFISVLLVCSVPVSAVAGQQNIQKNTPVLPYEIIASYRHDPSSFTQGLSFADDYLYEGTGLYGFSTLRRYRIGGNSSEIQSLPSNFFGEGVTVFGNRVIQLTWKSRKGLVWDKSTLSLIGSFVYPTEGWGLTHDGFSLIMSNGTDTLFFMDPEDFKLQKKVVVKDQGKSISLLNELEFIKGEIWANIWKKKRIARIHPLTGEVTAWVELPESAFDAAPAGVDNVLNGIAYDAQSDRIYVTGKRWDSLYEIRAVQVTNASSDPVVTGR